jgi:hypothetical protein
VWVADRFSRRLDSVDTLPRLGSSGAMVEPQPVDRTNRSLTMEDSPKAILPRKEVIQPQLPLRLPCYDFVPVTNPTLGGCVP